MNPGGTPTGLRFAGWILVCSWLAFHPVGALAQSDIDSDGVPDVQDNCSIEPNASQCDRDHDGIGNGCDGDFDNDGSVDPVDLPLLLADLAAPSIDSGIGSDMDCNCCVNALDFMNNFVSGVVNGFPGPSGLPCAGTPGCGAGATASCRTTPPCGPN